MLFGKEQVFWTIDSFEYSDCGGAYLFFKMASAYANCSRIFSAYGFQVLF